MKGAIKSAIRGTVLALVALAGVAQADTVTYDWSTFPTDSAGITTGITANQRPGFFGVVSQIGSQKTYPGSFGSGGYRFVELTGGIFDNTSGAPELMQVSFDNESNEYVGMYFYINSFDPNNQPANYLADSGFLSVGCCGTAGFTIPTGADVVAILITQLNQTNPVPAGRTFVTATVVPEPQSVILLFTVVALVGLAVRFRHYRPATTKAS
jgi:hypothetical protein